MNANHFGRVAAPPAPGDGRRGAVRRVLFAATVGITCGLVGGHRAQAADAYIYNIYPSGALGGNTALWNAAGQPYSAWYDQTTNAFTGTNLPPAGGTVSIALLGGVGVSGLSVTFNAFYGTGSAALSGLAIDSGNTLVQNAGNTQLSVMILPPQPFAPPTGYPAHEYVGLNSTGSYVQSAGSNVADVLHVGGNAGGSGTYTMSGGSLIAAQAYVGDGGSGTITQSAGVAQLGSLAIGYAGSGVGLYSLSGSGSLAPSSIAIGRSGSGTLQQIGGSLATGGSISLGTLAGGRGNWTMSSGSATIGQYVRLGEGSGGSGTISLSGGLLHLTGATNGLNLGALELGYAGGASGTLLISGGTLLSDAGELVGVAGNGSVQQTGGVDQTSSSYLGYVAGGGGTFDQSAGTHVATLLSIGHAGAVPSLPAATGSYTLGGGSLQAGDEYIGNGGIGTFLQTGGAHTIGFNGTGGLNVAFSASSQGSLTLSGGTLTAERNAYIGYSGAGTVTQTTGTIAFQAPSGGTNALYLGYNAKSSGAVNLSGTSAVFQVLNGGSEYVGYGGAGAFSQQSGTHTVSGSLVLGYASGSSGSYNLSGGTLGVGGSAWVGSNGAAVFNHLGGAFDVAGSMTLGTTFGPAVTYTMSNAASLTVGGSETIGGYPSSVTFNQYGGAHTVAGSLLGATYQSSATNATPVYNLYDGTLAVTGSINVHSLQQAGGSVTAGALFVQQYGLSNGASLHVLHDETVYGTLAQTGGTHLVDGGLIVGTNTIGSVALSGASSLFSVYNDERIGVGSSTGGSFVQSGGVHNVGTASHAASVTVGSPDNVRPGYQISGGQLNVSGSVFVAGATGTSVFAQSGGSVVVSGNNSGTVRGFLVGVPGQPSGRMTQSGGSLSVGPQEVVGYQDNGTWTQSGGTNQTGSLIVAQASNGSYSLTNGTLNVSGPTYVGYLNGNGTFTQSGGTCSTGSLTLGYFNTAGQVTTLVGQYNLSAGALAVTGNEQLGAGAGATMTQSGGVHTIGGTLSLSSGSFKTGVLNLTGGSLAAASTLNAGAINQSGGTSTLGVITGGGTISLGASAGPSLMNVTSFSQLKVSISGGLMRVAATGGAGTNTATSLSITGAGVLDLNEQNLLTATAASSVRQYLTDGYNGGAWNGSAAAIVSTAASLTGGTTAMTLGYATGGSADVVGVAIPAGQTLVKYTIPGDADLSGSVDFNDFLSLQNDYGSSGDWAQGDFNYDGVVDYNDYLMLQANYGRTPTDLDASIGAAPYIAAPTPEPAALGLAGLGAISLLSRRRRLLDPKCPTDAAGTCAPPIPIAYTPREAHQPLARRTHA